MAAFEGAIGVRVAAEADAVAERPDAHDFVELIARGGEAGGGGVCVVEERDGRMNTALLENGFHLLRDLRAFELREIGRVFDDAVAHNAGQRDADGVEIVGSRAPLRLQRGDEITDDIDEGIGGQVDEAVQFIRIFGIAAHVADEPMVLDEAGGDVCGHDHADASAHNFHFPCFSTTRPLPSVLLL